MATLTLAGVIGIVIGVINKLIPILITLALLFFFWNCVKYITSASGEGGTSARSGIIWGLVGLFVIVSVWGILRILCNTFVGVGMCR